MFQRCQIHDGVIKWKIFRVTGLCAGNSPVTGEFPSQRRVTRSFDVFFDLRLNKRLSTQWRRRWFKTPSCPLLVHCNVSWISPGAPFNSNGAPGNIQGNTDSYDVLHQYPATLIKIARLDIVLADTWQIPRHFICYGLWANTMVGPISLRDNRGLYVENRYTLPSKLINGLTRIWHDPNGIFHERLWVNLFSLKIMVVFFLTETMIWVDNNLSDVPPAYDDLIKWNKRLVKQTWGWWFETPSCPLWRRCNANCCAICKVMTWLGHLNWNMNIRLAHKGLDCRLIKCLQNGSKIFVSVIQTIESHAILCHSWKLWSQ